MVLIKRFLDIGAQTLLIPYVQTEEEAERAVAATRYPPKGVRGVAGATRASALRPREGLLLRASEEICVLVQIETRAALDNLEKIATVDGVDGVFIGPGDLAAGLGHVGNIRAPRSAERHRGRHRPREGVRQGARHPDRRREGRASATSNSAASSPRSAPTS